jgi:Tfp pilus assembly protein PilF
VSCLVTRGILELSNGTPKLAIIDLTNARDLDPSSWEIQDWISKAYDADKNALQAEDTLKSAVDAHPNYWAIQNRLGEFYFRHGQYANAEPRFLSVTELTPQNTLGFSNLGRVYVAEGRYHEAEEKLNRALELKGSPDSLFELGKAYLYDNRYDDASRTFRNGLETSPKNYQMWRKLGDSLNLAQKKSEAHSAFVACARSANAEFHDVNRDDAQILANKALCFLKSGSRRPAKTLIDQALTEAPRSADVLFAAGVIDATLGDEERAMKEIAAALAAGYPLSEVLNEPDLATVHNNPLFQKLMNLPSLAGPALH